MSLTQEYDFSVPGDYIILEPTKVEVAGNQAILKLVNDVGKTYDQDFSNSAGFTFDASKILFAAGEAKQISQLGADGSLVATFSNDVNGNYGLGVLAGTANGGAAVVGGKLNLKGGTTKYVDFAGLGNTASGNIIAFKFKITPNYSGAPSSYQAFTNAVNSPSPFANQVILFHSTSGNLEIWVSNSSAVTIISGGIGAWSPVLGVTYEIYYHVDLTNGDTRVFVDGVQIGTTKVTTGTRTQASILRIGGDNVPSNTPPDFEMEDLIVYNAKQHVTNYASGYIVSETEYMEARITLPQFNYPGIGTILAFTNFIVSVTGAARWIIDGLYYNGGWVASDDSYTQSSDAATILANIATLPANDNPIVDVVFPSGAVRVSASNMSLEYTGQIYPIDDPTISNNNLITTDGLVSVIVSTTIAGSDSVQIRAIHNGIKKYWNGTNWTNSDGSFLQSNTLLDFNTNIATLVSNSNPGTLGWEIHLRSSDGSTTPSVQNVQVIYDFFAVADTLPTCCIVYGRVIDSQKNGIAGMVITAQLAESAEGSVSHYQVINRKAVFTSLTDGYWELGLIRSSEVNNKLYNFSFVDGSTESINVDVVVPDLTNQNFNNMVTPDL